jgi:predicted secreted Zn-dependent protease
VGALGVRRLSWAGALCALSLLAGGRPAAEPQGPRIDYYQVFGSTISEVQESLHRLRPTVNGRRFAAVTRWNIRWDHTTAMGEAGCALAPVRVTLNVYTIAPQWSRPRMAALDLVQRWRNYEVALLVHERGHYDIAAAGALAIENALKALPPAAECVQTEHLADAAGHRLLADIHEKQRLYDLETEHGHRQGARFP